MRNSNYVSRAQCNLLVYYLGTGQASQNNIILGDAFLQSFFTQFAYNASGIPNNNQMTLQIATHALNNTFIGLGGQVIKNNTDPFPDPFPVPDVIPVPDPAPYTNDTVVPNTPSKTPMSQGAVIGISAGVASTFVLLLTLIWYFAYYRKAAAAQETVGLLY